MTKEIDGTQRPKTPMEVIGGARMLVRDALIDAAKEDLPAPFITDRFTQVTLADIEAATEGERQTLFYAEADGALRQQLAKHNVNILQIPIHVYDALVRTFQTGEKYYMFGIFETNKKFVRWDKAPSISEFGPLSKTIEELSRPDVHGRQKRLFVNEFAAEVAKKLPKVEAKDKDGDDKPQGGGDKGFYGEDNLNAHQRARLARYGVHIPRVFTPAENLMKLETPAIEMQVADPFMTGYNNYAGMAMPMVHIQPFNLMW